MRKEIEKLLQSVQKPARYAGGELNSVMKDKSKVALRYAFADILLVPLPRLSLSGMGG